MTTAKILIVDDDEPNLDAFEAILRLDHYTVVKSRDGLDALDKFEKLQPDLVMLDLMIPTLNGYDVCSHLKRRARGRHVPILMLSGLGEAGAKATAIQCGADDFLAKPFQADTLRHRIRTLLASRPTR